MWGKLMRYCYLGCIKFDRPWCELTWYISWYGNIVAYIANLAPDHLQPSCWFDQYASRIHQNSCISGVNAMTKVGRLGMDDLFHPTLYCACDYLSKQSMLVKWALEITIFAWHIINKHSDHPPSLRHSVSVQTNVCIPFFVILIQPWVPYPGLRIAMFFIKSVRSLAWTYSLVFA